MSEIKFDYHIQCGFYECDEYIEIEDLYQAFKNRMIYEIYGTSKDIQDVVILHDQSRENESL